MSSIGIETAAQPTDFEPTLDLILNANNIDYRIRHFDTDTGVYTLVEGDCTGKALWTIIETARAAAQR